MYTDGSALGNPGPGGYGVVLMSGPYRKELSCGYAHTTNNRMELMAVIAGLESAQKRRLRRNGLFGLEICGRCRCEGMGLRLGAQRIQRQEKSRPVAEVSRPVPAA